MSDYRRELATDDRWPRLWRFTLIALATLILCSCRGPAVRSGPPSAAGQAAMGPTAPYPTLPAEAFTGPQIPPLALPPGPPGFEQGVPLPYAAAGPWAPPGISQPWPPDEYVCDGGHAGPPIQVGNNWEIRGLEMEDAVAHFDTLDGRTLVEPSNRVCIYAPRFGAVRQTISLRGSEQWTIAGDVNQPIQPHTPTGRDPVGNAKQNYQVRGEIRARPSEIMRTRQGDGVLSTALKAREFAMGFRAYENAAAIRQGMMIESEMAFLARGTTAAKAWASNQAVQVILDRQAAQVEAKDESSQEIHIVGSPPGQPRLRVIKVASTQFAEPGDEVSFTIRFDNLGNQRIGNVTIVDSLNTRLEFVPASAQCSLDANFSTQPNDGGSVVVRCEITNPLEPGKGGVLRFRCLVR